LIGWSLMARISPRATRRRTSSNANGAPPAHLRAYEGSDSTGCAERGSGRLKRSSINRPASRHVSLGVFSRLYASWRAILVNRSKCEPKKRTWGSETWNNNWKYRASTRVSTADWMASCPLAVRSNSVARVAIPCPPSSISRLGHVLGLLVIQSPMFGSKTFGSLLISK
jgi:hypothetical protein